MGSDDARRLPRSVPLVEPETALGAYFANDMTEKNKTTAIREEGKALCELKNTKGMVVGKDHIERVSDRISRRGYPDRNCLKRAIHFALKCNSKVTPEFAILPKSEFVSERTANIEEIAPDPLWHVLLFYTDSRW